MLLKEHGLLTYEEGNMSHQKKIMGVFNESIMVKMKFEVTMGVCGERPWAWRAW